MSRVGRKTLGLLLLLVGGILLAQQVSSFGFIDIFGYIWPIIFVGIVIEIIYYYRLKESEERVQFDKGAMIILVFTMVVSGSMQNIQQSGMGILQGFSFIDWEDNGITVPFEERYELTKDISEIQFDLPNARLIIEGTDEEHILLSGTMKANKNSESSVENTFEDSRSTEIVSGNIFRYIVEEPKSSWFFSNENLSVDVVISLPQDRMIDVDITNGTVEVFDIEESVDVRTTNGRVKLEDIIGDVNVRNTNGTVSLFEIDGKVDAVTTNGRISATNLASDVILKTTNGAVELESQHVGGEWNVGTTNGNVTLWIPQDSDVSFEGQTTNGSVDGDLNWIRENDESFFGKSNEGSAIHNLGTYQIKGKGTNGSIRISFLQ